MCTYVDHIVERTVLSNSDQDGLMVRCGVDRSKTIAASRETVRDVSGQDTVVGLVVETLEESEDVRVRWGGLLH